MDANRFGLGRIAVAFRRCLPGLQVREPIEEGGVGSTVSDRIDHIDDLTSGGLQPHERWRVVARPVAPAEAVEIELELALGEIIGRDLVVVVDVGRRA